MAPKVRGDQRAANRPDGAGLLEYRRKRNFERTPEPPGGSSIGGADRLRFVVQRHAARRLHFDLRLEHAGVMKSWAVPKGPSLDPSVKRLAVEVEDHPMEYNSFEGTIPAGEYGGGTVMLWDRGTFRVDGLASRDKAETAMRKGLRAGKLTLEFEGERLRGGYALVRTGPADGEKPGWLLMKQDDRFADDERDIVAEESTSIDTGRTMQEIAEGKGGSRVWRAGGVEASGNAKRTGSGTRQARHLTRFSPMLATPAREPPAGDGWTFEPKWDGIRVVAFAAADGAALLTRNGNDKRKQFPEVARALGELAKRVGRPLVLDGELVGRSEDGAILRFESLQSRMHTDNASVVERLSVETPAALVVFDLLVDGEDVLLAAPWAERRTRLQSILTDPPDPVVQLGESDVDREALLRRAAAEGWEGIIAKRIDAPYDAGIRSRNWLKLKMENRQEFVVGGWTEPRNSRQHIGALLLGYHDDDGALRYAGHTGTGFSQTELHALSKRLRRLERKTSPFAETPPTNERAHWTTPRLVVEVRFNEWTRKGILRQPVYVGIRDDRSPAEIVREPAAGDGIAPSGRDAEISAPARPARGAKRGASAERALAAIEHIAGAGGSGELKLGRSARLELTSLGKLFFPRVKKTKGDLLRYYAGMADHILPFMKDRPLVLKRFPDGEQGKSFYQQNAPESVPPGVRVEILHDEDGAEQRRFVGGNLATLLHTVQLGAISYDPWHSRVGRLDFADYTILDLDPGPGASFPVVIAVARAVKEELDRSQLRGALKTSGSTGLHIYLPLPARTPLESATLVAQIIATRVAARHPEIATVERLTRNRPSGTVYVDYLQNILGKTVAGVYAARARPLATVSTPLAWSELTDSLDPGRFTIDSVPDRVASIGEIWGPAMSVRNSLGTLLPPS